ncbi:hypothetical protein [Glycomyces buryatensis]|uniref:Asparagine synthetase domain-containing protein n=1 Tax=Glycomyces buryatensis TaxID=2570927 RepID=A0A4S8QI70_9ACTN|nr:hypothetical protein [Glycomyces buryatensis]THV41089.1 hypothetical protein FAB82_13380 [Glycomyces buryatensis]
MPRALIDRLTTWARPKRAPVEIESWSESGLPESEIPAEGDHGDLLWARGFLLTAEAHPLPVAHWRRIRLGGRHVSYDPRNPIALARAGSSWVALLGRAVDLGNWSAGHGRIAETLLRARLAGRGAMIERLDMLSGRYALFDGDGRAAFAQTDAAGMRGLFFATGTAAPCAASHAGLVAERIGAGPSAFPDPDLLRRELHAYALPGRATTAEGVVMLTPNTELDLGSGKVHRCFPREPRRERPADEVADELMPLLQGQLAALAERGPLEVSLTAGLDSRTTLALTKPLSDRFRYFTYDTVSGKGPSRRGVARDVAVSVELAARFGLDHRRIEVACRFPAEPLRSIMERNSPRHSNPGMAAAHRDQTPDPGLHLRSNLYEIGRAFYRARRNNLPEVLRAEDMTSLLTARRSRDPRLRDAFAEYIGATDFDRAQQLYDGADLFYWEHRAGMWLNAHLTESDIAFDTHILVNSRHVYRLLLSAPQADRQAGTVFLELIRRSWPEVLDLPVNGTRLA